MLNLGFLIPTVSHSEAGQILDVPAAVSRPGRPVQVLLSYEDMLSVRQWQDDSKLNFKKALEGAISLPHMLPTIEESREFQ
jgi:hypothetical protein